MVPRDGLVDVVQASKWWSIMPSKTLKAPKPISIVPARSFPDHQRCDRWAARHRAISPSTTKILGRGDAINGLSELELRHHAFAKMIGIQPLREDAVETRATGSWLVASPKPEHR